MARRHRNRTNFLEVLATAMRVVLRVRLGHKIVLLSERIYGIC